ncbi:SidA/IucD/PvdA family monooxygenase [Serratia ureilytica]
MIRRCVAKNICLGTGHTPWLPKAFYPALGENCMHAAEIALRNRTSAASELWWWAAAKAAPMCF